MLEKKHLLFFASSLGRGGAEMHLLRLLNNLDRNRFRISLALARGGGSYERDLDEHVRVHHLPTGTLNSSTLRLVRAVRPLRKLIDAERPDLVCSVMDYSNMVMLRAVQGSVGRPPVVLLVQNSPVNSYKEGEGLLGAVAYRLFPRMYRAADRIIALSQGVAEEHRALLPETSAAKVTVIHNIGVDKSMQKKVDEQMPGASDEGPLLVGCGRLTELKGFTYLLDAFAKVQRHMPKARLRILGEGELRPTLERKIDHLSLGDRVQMPGFQENPFQHMAAADLFVLSSLYEGFGNVIVEAMACGAPVVATDCPHGPGEIITDGVNGLLVPTADAGALAGAIERALTDSSLRRKLAQKGRERAQDFEGAKIAEEYEKCFEDAIYNAL